MYTRIEYLADQPAALFVQLAGFSELPTAKSEIQTSQRGENRAGRQFGFNAFFSGFISLVGFKIEVVTAGVRAS
jgi:hypothetical protein